MVSIVHAKTSTVSVDPASAVAGMVTPDDWNEDHALTFAAEKVVVGRKSSGAGVGEECSASDVLDFLGTARGSIVYRGASGWNALAPGTAGKYLQTQGASADPQWAENALPPGLLFPYAGSSAPSGYLLCDGSAVSRTTYASLFAVISTTYGTGDGSTTFTLPDLRGRTPVGKDNMGGSTANRVTSAGSGITGTTLGATGGAENKTLTTTELPAHTHTGTSAAGGSHNHTATTSSDGSHAHNVHSVSGGGATYGAVTSTATSTTDGNVLTIDTNSAGSHTHTLTTTTASTHTHTFTSDSSGTGSAFGVMNPSIILNYIIKT